MSTQIHKTEAEQPALTRTEKALLWMMGQVEKRGARLENLLHPDMPKDRFEESCRLAFAKNPDLTDLNLTDGASLMQALMLGARSGLDVHGHYGHLVSFQNKAFDENGKKVWKAVIVFMPDYKGMLATLKAAGCVLDAEAIAVREFDEFTITGGDEPRVHHAPQVRRKAAEPVGEIIAAYTRFLLPSGRWVVKGLMLLEDIERIEGSIKAKNGPWSGPHRVRMILKSSFRQAWPWLGPTTSDRSVALRLAALEEAEALEAEWSAAPAEPVRPVLTGVAAAKANAQKALQATSTPAENWVPSEEEKAAILAGEQESAHAST